MTIEAWQLIAVIIVAIMTSISTLAAPSLAELVKWRISQSKDATRIRQQNSLKYLLLRIFLSFWFVYLLCGSGMIMSSYGTYLVAIGPTEISRFQALAGAVFISGFFFFLIMWFHFRFRQRLFASFEDLVAEAMINVRRRKKNTKPNSD